jgi:hypothetical protein
MVGVRLKWRPSLCARGDSQNIALRILKLFASFIPEPNFHNSFRILGSNQWI